MADSKSEINAKIENFPVNSPSFQTTLISAFEMAMRHHQEQELAALRNTVLNAGLPNAPEADIQRMFLNWLDEFTSWHLMLLRYLQEYNANDIQVIEEGLEVKRPFYNQVLQDLQAKGLIYLKEVYVAKEKNKEYERQFPNPIPLPSTNLMDLGYRDPYKDTNIVVFKRVENIDKFIKEGKYYCDNSSKSAKVDRITDVGKLFLDFIKNPIEKVSFDRSQQ
ncbi:MULTISPECIES: hypothetical protein [Kamptonema]|uniref:hypothetical protein n=1 Tax=Kamptonema TaxID=1501433 RepID=UPI0001DAD0BF|nr:MULTISPECIES: hypothetical protein [Kamptonema]CBN57670.1 hypothetical protein OSCI_3490050 [Kamptonema sp. PCC 6506]